MKQFVIACMGTLISTSVFATDFDAVQQLQTYIGIDTVNPPGYTTSAVEFLRDEFAKVGVTTEIVGPDPNKPTLVAKINGQTEGPAVILLHHMDVVPAGPQDWTHPPYKSAIADGQIWGRGALDTKSLGILQLHALQSLLSAGLQPSRTIYYVGMPDEETQGPAGASWFVEQYLPEMGPIDLVLNEGGVGNVGVFGQDQIVMLVQTAEKQPFWTKIEVTGDSGHGSAPHNNNAANKLIEALNRLFSTPLRAEVTPAVAEMLAVLSETESGINRYVMNVASTWPFSALILNSMAKKSPQARSSTRNSCSLTGLEAGVKTNVIPPVASATLDCRLLPTEDLAGFQAKLKKMLAEPDLTIEPILVSPSGPISPSNVPVFDAIRHATKKIYPNAVVAPYMSAGYTDNAFFRRKGIPAYGFNPVVLNPEQIKGIHNVNERIGHDAYLKAVDLYREMIKLLAF